MKILNNRSINKCIFEVNIALSNDCHSHNLNPKHGYKWYNGIMHIACANMQYRYEVVHWYLN